MVNPSVFQEEDTLTFLVLWYSKKQMVYELKGLCNVDKSGQKDLSGKNTKHHNQWNEINNYQ